jgi:diamine N-acetyltransferase
LKGRGETPPLFAGAPVRPSEVGASPLSQSAARPDSSPVNGGANLLGVEFRDAAPGDAAALAAFGARAFSETFAHLYPPEDLEAFLAAKFGAAQQRAEIVDPANHLRLALEQGAIIGFCYSGSLALDAPAGDAAPRELHRLYVSEAAKGRGVAPALMQDALAWARGEGADALYLSVWENNFRAQRFYKRYGFEHVGEHGFMVGKTRDRDFILRLNLRAA